MSGGAGHGIADPALPCPAALDTVVETRHYRGRRRRLWQGDPISSRHYRGEPALLKIRLERAVLLRTVCDNTAVLVVVALQ